MTSSENSSDYLIPAPENAAGSTGLPSLQEAIPIVHVLDPTTETVSAYVDILNEVQTPVDYAGLRDYIFEGRTAARMELGIALDPIDDAPYIPAPADFVGYMRTDQVEKDFPAVFAAYIEHKGDTSQLAHRLSSGYVSANLKELLGRGMEPASLLSRLSFGEIRANMVALRSAGVSKVTVYKSLVQASFRSPA